MRLPLIFSLLISMSTFAEEKSTIIAGERSIKSFEDLTTQLFHTPRIWEWNIDYEIFDTENKAINGAQYLYCASVADFLAKVQDAPKFYDKGMAFLEKYSQYHAIRDVNAYDKALHYSFFSNNIPYYHQSWLIDNKETLKGVIFNSIYKIIEAEFYKDNPLANKNHRVLIKIYNEECSKLN